MVTGTYCKEKNLTNYYQNMNKLSYLAVTANMLFRIGDNSIPKFLTVNGEQVPTSEIPEYATLLEVLSADERRKVYGKMEELSKDNIRLSNEVALLKSTGPAPTPTPTNPANPLQKSSGEWDLSGLSKEQIKAQLDEANAKHGKIDVDALAAAMSQAFAKQIQPVIDGLTSLANSVQPLQKKAIADYRAERLAALGSTVIPELVKGETESQIEESIVESMAIAAKYLAAPNPPTPTPTPTPPPTGTPVAGFVPTPPTPTPVAPALTPVVPIVELGSPLKELKGMSPEEFAKNRATMMKEVNKLTDTVVVGA